MIGKSQKYKSIYSVINENCKDGIVSRESLLRDLEKESLSLSNRNIQVQDKSLIVDQLFMVVEGINISEIKNWKTLESELMFINYEVNQIVSLFMERFSIYFLTNKVYKFFKELLYKTTDIEAFKIAIIVTGLYKDNDLVSEYKIISQLGSFNELLYRVARKWDNSNKAKGIFLELLKYSKDNLTLNVMGIVLRDKMIIKDMKNQRNIFLYSIRNISNKGKIVYPLLLNLNIRKLMIEFKDDFELEWAFNEFYFNIFNKEDIEKSKYFEKAFVYDIMYYFIYLKTKAINGEILYGLRTLNGYLNLNKFNENSKIVALRTEVKEYYKKIFSLSIVKGALVKEIRFIEWTNFVNKNKINSFSNIYIDRLKENPLEYLSIYTLVQIGDTEEHEILFNILKGCYNIKERSLIKKNYILRNENNKNVNSIKLLINSLEDFQNEESLLLLQKILEDNDANIRLKALEVIEKFSKELYNEKVIFLIKQMLSDSPELIRDKAYEICYKKEIFLNRKEINKVTKILEDRENNNFSNYKIKLKALIKGSKEYKISQKERVALSV